MPTMFPYPGLRPYQSDQTDIFFGREVQTDELLRKLSQTRFLGVVGPSGCGKSSLVMAGMISALETGFMVMAGARWKIAIMRPGSHPLRRLAGALMDDVALGIERTGDYAVSFLEAILHRGPRGLVEVLTETPLAADTSLLVLVDQFEELFRLRNEENRNEQDAFVALLLETASQHEVPVYVVLTMRSDYLGDCALFPGLPEALNKSQYLTPRMDREQRRAAIVGPARVFGGDVEPSLINRLLNETGTDPNQLPVLQHLLMRMWASTRSTKAVPPGAPFFADIPTEMLGHVLTISDYEQVGGIAGALSLHADQAFNSLKDEQKLIAEILFRGLCERGDGCRDGRRPTSLRIIADRARVRPDQIIEIVEVFRNPAYGFLVPAPPEPLYENTVIDITHESLIRLWKRLDAWVEQEAKSAETYRFLEQSARRWKEGQAALWGTPNLEIAMTWKEHEQPSGPWAERYGGNFELAMEFLGASEEEQRRQQVRAHEAYLRKLRRARMLAVSLGMVAVLLCSSILVYCYLFVWEYSNYYNTVVKVHGIPVGVGKKLERIQYKARPVSLKIVKKGRWGDDKNDVLRMEAVNGSGTLTPNHDVGTYFDPYSKQMSLSRECKWEYIRDPKGRIMYERALNKYGELVWVLSYSPPPEGLALQSLTRDALYLTEKRWLKRENISVVAASEDMKTFIVIPDSRLATLYNVEKSKIIRESGRELKDAASKIATAIPFIFSEAKIVNIEYSSKGYEERIRYFDGNRKPIVGPDKALGKFRKFGEGRVEGLEEELTSIGQYGTPMNDEDGKATLRMTRDELGNILTVEALDARRKPVMTNSGWHRFKAKYDSRGNRIESAFFGLTEGERVLTKDGYHSETGKYDDRGNRTEWAYFGLTEGERVLTKDRYHKATGKYDNRGNRIEWAYFGLKEEPIPYENGSHKETGKYDDRGNRTEWAYFGLTGEPILLKNGNHKETGKYDVRGNRTEWAYYGIKKEPVLNKDGYHRAVAKYDERENRCMWVAYYDTAGELIVDSAAFKKLELVIQKRPPQGKLREQLFWLVDVVYACYETKDPILIEEAINMEEALGALGEYLETGDQEVLERATRATVKFAHILGGAIAAQSSRK